MSSLKAAREAWLKAGEQMNAAESASDWVEALGNYNAAKATYIAEFLASSAADRTNAAKVDAEIDRCLERLLDPTDMAEHNQTHHPHNDVYQIRGYIKELREKLGR